MANSGLFGDSLEMLKEEAGISVKAVAAQITGSQQSSQQQQPQAPAPKPQGIKQVVKDAIVGSGDSSQQMPKIEQSDEQKEFVKDLYGEAKPVEEQEVQKKEAEEKQKIEALRQRLHSDYYQKLVNPPKQQEEKPAEKVEREKMEDLQKDEKDKADKPPPLAVDRAQNMEKFRGASG